MGFNLAFKEVKCVWGGGLDKTSFKECVWKGLMCTGICFSPHFVTNILAKQNTVYSFFGIELL
jgi:hypothetical protein